MNLQGYLLAASPYLDCPDFEESVILVLEHNPEGAIGIQVNRPAGDPEIQAWKVVAEHTGGRNARVGVGGPESGPVVALHTSKRHADVELVNGLYVAADAHRATCSNTVFA